MYTSTLKKKTLLIFISCFFFTPQIKKLSEKELSDLICERHKEINEKKEHWKKKLAESEHQQSIDQGRLHAVEEGNGGAYILYDQNETPRFVIKPNDEDIFCLNNRKEFASPFFNRAFRVRKEVTTYRAAQ